MSKWEDIKIYDLSIPIGISTPPWPTYEPLQVKYFKRLAPNGANGQLVTHSNHVGTHLDGPRHFDTSGRDVASLELEKLCGDMWTYHNEDCHSCPYHEECKGRDDWQCIAPLRINERARSLGVGR